MDINDEIDLQDLKYKVKELQEKNEELQVELDITKEQLILASVSQRSELLPKPLTYMEGHKPECKCEPCSLLKKIFGNCG